MAFGTVSPGGGGVDPTFTTLTLGQVPKSDGSQLIYGNATVDPTTLQWTFDESINVPSGSINVGEVLQLTEGTADLVTVDLLKNQMSFVTISNFDDSVGSAPPFYIDYGSAQTLTLQAVDTTVITANPLDFQLTGTVVAPDIRLVDEFTLRTNGAMTNARMRVTDNATGLVIRYIPSKTDFDNGVGFSLIAGDNTFFLASNAADTPGNFNLGFQPFVIEAGQLLDFRIEADAVDLLGNASNVPFIRIEAHDGPPRSVGGNVTAALSLENNAVVIGQGGVNVATSNRVSIVSNALVLQESVTNEDLFIQFNDDVAATHFQIQYDGTNNDVEIESFLSNSISILSDNSVTLQADTLLQFISVTNGIVYSGLIGPVFTQSTDDLTTVATFNNSGTNPGQLRLFAGDRSPEGNVTTTEGAYWREDGVNTDLFIRPVGTSGNTGWRGILGTIDALDLATVLSAGNTTGGTNIALTSGDAITSTTTDQWLNVNANLDAAEIGFFYASNTLGAGAIMMEVFSGINTASGATIAKFEQGDVTPGGTTTVLDLDNLDGNNGICIDAGGRNVFTGQQVTSNTVIQVVADQLTTGSMATFTSNSADTSTRSLVSIINDNPLAVNTTVLTLRNDSTGSTTDRALNIVGRTTIDTDTLTTGQLGFDIDCVETTGSATVFDVRARTAIANATIVASFSQQDSTPTGTTTLFCNNSTTDGFVYVGIGNFQNTSSTLTGNGARFIANNTTTGTGVLINANGLTTGEALVVNSNSADTSVRNLVNIINDNVLAVNTTLLTLRNDAVAAGNDPALDITGRVIVNTDTLAVSQTGFNISCANTTGAAQVFDVLASTSIANNTIVAAFAQTDVTPTGTVTLFCENLGSGGLAFDAIGGFQHLGLAATGNAVLFDEDSTTTGTGVRVQADGLTTGIGLQVISNSASIGTRNLTEIINDNAASTGTTGLFIRQDSTGLALDVDGDTDINGFVELNRTNLPTTSFRSWGQFNFFSFASANPNSPSIDFEKSRGTPDTPTAILSDDFIGVIGFLGHNSVAFPEVANIRVRANENYSGSAQGSRMIFEVTPNATTTREQILELNNEVITFGNGTSPTQLTTTTTATTQNVFNITADSLTTGNGLVISSNSASASSRNLLTLINDNVLATGGLALRIQQDANARSFEIETFATTQRIFDIESGSLTTGTIARFLDSSSDTSIRQLVQITNSDSSATGTICLDLDQNSTGPLILLDRSGATVEVFADNATAVGNITGDPGDVNFLESGVNSNIQVHIGASANNTDWAGCVGGPAIVMFGANGVASTTTTRFLFPGYSESTAQTTAIAIRMPRTGFIRNMHIQHNIPAGNGSAIVYTVRVNGVASTLLVSIASTATTASDTTNVVSITAADTIDIEVTKAAGIGSTPNDIVATLEYV